MHRLLRPLCVKITSLSTIFFLLFLSLPTAGSSQVSTPEQGSTSSPPVSESTGAPSGEALAAFKQLSLEELMNLDVTSVSKVAEPYGKAPAAIQVVTHDDIRRFGASSFPEAMRLADNLYVAQANSSSWAISARGFNSSVGNKLLVLMDGRSIYSPLFSGVIWNMQDYLLNLVIPIFGYVVL